MKYGKIDQRFALRHLNESNLRTLRRSRRNLTQHLHALKRANREPRVILDCKTWVRRSHGEVFDAI